jgi:hypothetical protein
MSDWPKPNELPVAPDWYPGSPTGPYDSPIADDREEGDPAQ